MRKIGIGVLSAVIAFLIVLSGCDFLTPDDSPDPVSIAQRISLFEDDLNAGDTSVLYLHFHDDTLSKQSLASEEVFDTGPLSNVYNPFSFTVPATIPAADADGTIMIDTTFTNDTVTDESISFVMKEGETDVWYIYWLTITIGVDTYEIRRLN